MKMGGEERLDAAEIVGRSAGPSTDSTGALVRRAARPAELQFELPVAFRGYDRRKTDAFLLRLEAAFVRLGAERDTLASRLQSAETELEVHRSRTQAVGDALINAQGF